MIRQIHEWNAFGCLALSLVFNTVLIWLVLKRSPREMHVYSRILLHTAFGDLALSLALAITQPVFFTCADDRTVLFLNGPLVRNIPSTALQFVCIELAVLAVYFTVFGLCVQFVYRYLILLRNVSISLAHYFAMLLVLFSSSLVLCVLIFLVGYPSTGNEFIGWHQLPDMMAHETDGQPLHVVMASYPGPGWYCITALLLLINLFCYSVIIFCGYRMIKFVRENVSGHFVRPEILRMNRELTRSLILLASMPVLLNLVSLCVSACLLLTSASGSDSSPSSGTLSGTPSGSLSGFPVPLPAQLLSSLVGHWLPVFNPLIYIFTVRPYRRACISLGKVAPSTTIGANAQNGAVPMAFVNSIPQQVG